MSSDVSGEIGKVSLAGKGSPFPFHNKLGRWIWETACTLLFRSSPRLCHGWRCTILRAFGANIGTGVRVYPSCRIWAPWNLTMEDYSCLGDDVDCYNVDQIRIGAHATVSQHAHLCSATHDLSDPHMGLVTAPVTVESGGWIAAGAFIGPGVRIGEGSVVAARAVVVRDVPAWKVVGGNPACVLKQRKLR